MREHSRTELSSIQAIKEIAPYPSESDLDKSSSAGMRSVFTSMLELRSKFYALPKLLTEVEELDPFPQTQTLSSLLKECNDLYLIKLILFANNGCPVFVLSDL